MVRKSKAFISSDGKSHRGKRNVFAVKDLGNSRTGIERTKLKGKRTVANITSRPREKCKFSILYAPL